MGGGAGAGGEGGCEVQMKSLPLTVFKVILWIGGLSNLVMAFHDSPTWVREFVLAIAFACLLEAMRIKAGK
jgi:hypothetical protein